MNVILGELPDRLAAEYVLGTLAGGARRRFDALLPAHPALRHAVAAWESRLLPMALNAETVQPDARVWSAIESKLGWTTPAAAQPASAWRLRFWQLFATGATVAAVVLATVPRHEPVAAPMIVVLHATKGSETIVAGLSPDRTQLSIQPLQKVALTSDQSLELWALKKDGPPASLGVIAADKLTAVNQKTLPKDTKGLAVSLEPLGGSKTGAPTGPVLFVGDLTL
ncbi:MAG: anti-sigma factor [Caulobacter sp.]|nr:anti-sigma factor [Vitreoscilla sp.]